MMKNFGNSTLGELLGIALCLLIFASCSVAMGYNDNRTEVACYQAGGTWNPDADVVCDIP